MRGMIVAGGTGGHIYPGIAIGKRMKELYPGLELFFIGRSRDMERQIYKKEGLSFTGLNIKSSGFGFVIGFFQSLFIFLLYRPDFVLGLGSYISFPMIFWASLFGKPTFLQEQNVMPGVATRILQGRVEKIFFGYEGSSHYIKFKDRIRITGNPLRFKGDGVLCKKRNEILVFGGSLGAKKISESIVGVVDYIKKFNISFGYKFILITGREDYERFAKFEDESLLKVYKYVDQMEEFYKKAVLVISRAGALTVSEIAFFGLPAILIPYPFSKKGHQALNASLLVRRGDAVLIEDEKLTVDLLWKEIYNILRNRKKLKSFRFSTFKYLFKDSAGKIARFIIELKSGKGK